MALISVVVVLDWARLHSTSGTTRHETRSIFLRVGVSMALAVVLMAVLKVRSKWTVADLGWVVTISGMSALIIRFFARRDRPNLSEEEYDLILSLLEVGSTVLILGLLLILVNEFFRSKGGDDADGDKGDRLEGSSGGEA